MVCTLHTLGNGGILEATTSHKANYCIAWLLEIATYCAVNCFALISGFVSCKSTFKIHNLFRLWLQAEFYSLGIALIFKLTVANSLSLKDLICSCFPICTNEYWYLTSYAIMFFAIPQMNHILCHQSKEALRRFIWFFFIIFSVLAMVPVLSQIAFSVNRGYSSIWLAYLYIIGGFIRIHGIHELLPNTFILKKHFKRLVNSKTGLILTYVLCVGITFLLYTTGHYCILRTIGRDPFCMKYVNYNSPTILFAGIVLFLFFSQLNVSSIAPFIRIASPLAFSVYLIHCQKQISTFLFKGAFKWVANLQTWMLPFAIISISLAIYLVCSLIDFVRLRLFKLLHLA